VVTDRGVGKTGLSRENEEKRPSAYGLGGFTNVQREYKKEAESTAGARTRRKGPIERCSRRSVKRREKR